MGKRSRENLDPTPGIRLTTSGSGYLVTSEGYTLYRFLPLYLQKNSLGEITEANVTWGDEWPDRLQPLIFQYVPLPAPAYGGATVPGTISEFERNDGKYGYKQVEYNGWWLYIFTEDRAGEVKGIVPGIWDVVPADVEPLVPLDDDDVGNPPPGLLGGP
ncbi:hypothetical protein [Deinococcus roseus]|uniref:Uncharacterized protein n=1 Tax=Deinococcus roseus TaxID=392414 RepID=A0ABQ2D014_9DEIO|nr:hypothetical protein [Deinococcus roseus]GGJ37541.1 hypothetical protein GCM10008938_24590 [Deinococcus roseus]